MTPNEHIPLRYDESRTFASVEGLCRIIVIVLGNPSLRTSWVAKPPLGIPGSQGKPPDVCPVRFLCRSFNEKATDVRCLIHPPKRVLHPVHEAGEVHLDCSMCAETVLMLLQYLDPTSTRHPTPDLFNWLKVCLVFSPPPFRSYLFPCVFW